MRAAALRNICGSGFEARALQKRREVGRNRFFVVHQQNVPRALWLVHARLLCTAFTQIQPAAELWAKQITQLRQT